LQEAICARLEPFVRDKPYYSVRTGKNPLAKRFDLPALRDLFKTFFTHFEDEGYFQEALGFYCIDTGFTPGYLGNDLDGTILLHLRKRDLTPIRDKIDYYAEDDFFDVIEFLFDHCSKPINRRYHGTRFNDCGWHCEAFDRKQGQQEFRQQINMVLTHYDSGYELSAEGEILSLADKGLDGLFQASVPLIDPDNITARVDAACTKFRRYRSSDIERCDAIRELASVLEYLRPHIKSVLASKDESDLFNLANNFGIRHHNLAQKTDYDKPIWYSWMFYYYLATIHAVTRLIERNRK
jgi:hypothetical protein